MGIPYSAKFLHYHRQFDIAGYSHKEINGKDHVFCAYTYPGIEGKKTRHVRNTAGTVVPIATWMLAHRKPTGLDRKTGSRLMTDPKQTIYKVFHRSMYLNRQAIEHRLFPKTLAMEHRFRISRHFGSW